MPTALLVRGPEERPTPDTSRPDSPPRLLTDDASCDSGVESNRRSRSLLERLANALARERSIGVAVVLADEFAAVAVPEVKRDHVRGNLEHVERVPAEVMTVLPP